MKLLACTIAVLCLLSQASQAADSEWLQSPPAALGPRTSWQELPAAAFVEVGVSKFPLAQAVLSERMFALRKPVELTSLLGPGHGFTCGAGSAPYLVRAMYSGTGEFSLLWAGDTLVVAHGSLGAAGPSRRSALVACLPKAPAAVVSLVSGAI